MCQRWLLALALCATSSLHAADEAAQTSAALEKIVRELNDLDGWLNIADRKRIRLQKALREQDKEVAATSLAVAKATDDIAKAQLALAQLKDRKSRLLQQRDTQAASISDHLSAAYRLNGRDLFKQILNQENPAQFQRMLKYHQYFSTARVAAVNSFAQTIDELNANAEALANEQQRLQSHQQSLEDREAKLLADRTAQRRAVDELKAETATKTEQRKRLNADRERLEALLAELHKRSSALDGSGFVASKGNLAMPLNARIAQSYGSKRSDGELTWNGLLFNAAVGTQVQAVYQGRVVFADWLRGYGLLLILDHGGGYMTLYGHADSLNKAVGDWVESGEVIASAGRSGGQQRSGLYFEVRHKGKTHDPILWIKRNR